MYTALLIVHSLLRWIVLISLAASIYRAASGYFTNRPFSRWDNLLRHWTATIGHIQLIVGVILYTKSPIARFFWTDDQPDAEHTFFAVVHAGLMVIAITLLTIGSAMAKRKSDSREKYKTMLLWFLLALLIILMAIPWPFSPLASRPYYRH